MNHHRPPRSDTAAAIALLTNPQAAVAAGPAPINHAWNTLRAARRPVGARVRVSMGPFPGDAA